MQEDRNDWCCRRSQAGTRTANGTRANWYITVSDTLMSVYGSNTHALAALEKISSFSFARAPPAALTRAFQPEVTMALPSGSGS